MIYSKVTNHEKCFLARLQLRTYPKAQERELAHLVVLAVAAHDDDDASNPLTSLVQHAQSD